MNFKAKHFNTVSRTLMFNSKIKCTGEKHYKILAKTKRQFKHYKNTIGT